MERWRERAGGMEASRASLRLVTEAGKCPPDCGLRLLQIFDRQPTPEVSPNSAGISLDDGKLIEPTAEDCARGWEAYPGGEAGDAGIVDQVSFAVMRRLGLPEAFTSDRQSCVCGWWVPGGMAAPAALTVGSGGHSMSARGSAVARLWSYGLISRLIELVESFGGQRVLLVGDLILDRYIYGDADRISPEAPVVVLRKQHDEERVGGAGSVAVNLRELGLDVVCCGIVGLDDPGHRVRAMLESLQVGTRGILSIPGRPTTTKTRFVGLAQHRHRQQLMRVDDEITRALSAADAARFAELVVPAVRDVAAVCIEDYDKGLVSESLCRQVIAAARAAGKPVLVDPARVTDYGKYRGATLLTPNRAEFRAACGCGDDSLETIRANAAVLIDQLELEGLLVTLDREGCLLALRGEEPEHVPTRPRLVYDNTGAGDAVLAMVVAARVAGADWHEAARLTNVAGGLEVEKFGCVPVSREELIADLRISNGSAFGKIRQLDDLAAELALRRSRGETVVFTNGCYDLLHAGHVRFLEACRDLGNVVVVGVNSDASVRAQNKDGNRPIVPQDQRAEVLAALQAVDYVVIFDDPTPARIVARLSPDVLVKGQDWAERGVVGREHVEASGGRVVLLPLIEGISTSRIVERIRGQERVEN